ncbi:DUF1844 domain-containing protein [bacterium]|nr:DUF1844 domain-containing protein [bacterium]
MSDEKTLDMNFLSLIMAHHQAGLAHLGKVADPMSGKVERNLEAVRGTIAVLESLERKTRGNLVREEEQALQEAITFLRLNFVDEMKHVKEGEEPAAEAEEASAAEETTGD